MGGGECTTQLENFGFIPQHSKGTAFQITFRHLLNRAKEREIHTFWWAWEGMIRFELLQNIRFIEGIIHEDHHFGALLFAQSRKIAIMPSNLYNYRIRAGSTMTVWNANEIPSYLKPLCAHFYYKKARHYFRIYSLFITVKGIYDFAKNGVAQDLRADFENFTLPYLIDVICDIYAFYKDPYRLKPQIADLFKEIGVDSPLLPRKIKKHFAFYTRHILWNLAPLILPCYEWLKGLERTFRHWRRRVFSKNT